MSLSVGILQYTERKIQCEIQYVFASIPDTHMGTTIHPTENLLVFFRVQ